MTSPKALLAAIGLLVSVCSAHATQVRLDFVNQRGDAVLLDPLPNCDLKGKAPLPSGQSRAVTCSVNPPNGTSGVQVRTPDGFAVICYPYITSQSGIRVDNAGGNACSITPQGGAYRVFFANSGPLNIRVHNPRSESLMISVFTPSYNCTPRQTVTVAPGQDTTATCSQEDARSRDGVTIQARVKETLVCQAWWHESRIDTFQGPCTVSGSVGAGYVLDVR
jgi:hypothetical protein